MNQLKVIEKIDAHTWNSFVKNPMQSYEWGESRISLGLTLIRFGVYENDVLKKTFHLILKSIPYTWYFWAHCARSDFFDDTTLLLIKEYAQENKIAFVNFELDVFVKKDETVSKLLTQTSQHTFASVTQLVDISKEEDLIFENFSKTIRRDIRFGIKNGLRVEIGSSEQLYQEFENLLFKTTHRQNFSSFNKNYHRHVFNSTKETISQIIVVYNEKNIPVAASEFFVFKNTAYYIYAGSLGKETPVGAMYLLIWEIIKYAKSKNCNSLDLWGSLPEVHNLKHPWSGFTRFKKGFGTVFKEYTHATDLVVSKGPYFIYKILLFCKSTLTFIKKKLL